MPLIALLHDGVEAVVERLSVDPLVRVAYLLIVAHLYALLA